MATPVIEISDSEYCIKLDKTAVNISVLHKLVARIHDTDSNDTSLNEKHLDDLQTKAGKGEEYDRLDDK